MEDWWDHSFDNRPNIDAYFEKNNSKIIRPANFYESDAYPLPWKWYQILEKDGYRILVIQLLWEVFMSIKVDNPFEKITQILSEVPKESYDTYIVEFHRETTKIEQKLNGKYVMNAIVVDIDTDSWLCSHIENISFTGNL